MRRQWPEDPTPTESRPFVAVFWSTALPRITPMSGQRSEQIAKSAPWPQGASDCPCELEPQQVMVPSTRMAHEWPPPAEMALN